MFNLLKRALNQFVFMRFLGLFRSRNGALGQMGWKSVNFENLLISGKSPVPWFVYGAIDYLEHSVDPRARILELGGGGSTAFWVNRGHHVTVIETDKNWASTILDNIIDSPNLSIFVCPEINSVVLHGLDLGDFDVVVNDFRGDRAEVAKWILIHLKKDGVVVWDNSDREEYSDGLQLLRESGMGWISFFGLGPVNSQAWETTILSTSLSAPTWPIRKKSTIR